jgi:hypothetical protein
MPITEQTLTEPRTVSTAFAANDFIRKWRAVELKERSAAQEHFLDLCRLVGEPTPAEADPIGDPACGSGNFLYLALVELKNIERRVPSRES